MHAQKHCWDHIREAVRRECPCDVTSLFERTHLVFWKSFGNQIVQRCCHRPESQSESHQGFRCIWTKVGRSRYSVVNQAARLPQSKSRAGCDSARQCANFGFALPNVASSTIKHDRDGQFPGTSCGAFCAVYKGPQALPCSLLQIRGAFMNTNGSQITESAQRNAKLPVRCKHRYLAGVVLNCVSKRTQEAECAKT